ncbi:Uncharacterised protein [Canicola haemoglobinophilus]|uniref:Uncharacterized protein n=1 Tax=Canicola haemoglobinophilus TaxID=733 RepID=A0AB38H8S7_9PAST|nr:hypothetical protein [Canicola haemoglobinophilus]STO54231.1 Uncharacterised protein [Canicola haemoglobinophilus]STO68764.1 Uncharacterised protein [Canicola haemoglobinophilus]
MNYRFWYFLIFSLSLPPLISTIYGIFKEENINSGISISIAIPEGFTIESCTKKKNQQACLEVSKSIEHTKNEIRRIQTELENNISASLRAYDKNMDILSFSLSLYAILITVIALFFSFRESQRIDEGLKKMEDSLSNVTSSVDNKLNEANERISTLDETINTRLLQIAENRIGTNANQTELNFDFNEEQSSNQLDINANSQSFSNS